MNEKVEVTHYTERTGKSGNKYYQVTFLTDNGLNYCVNTFDKWLVGHMYAVEFYKNSQGYNSVKNVEYIGKKRTQMDEIVDLLKEIRDLLKNE